jgi:N-acetylmuramoyl-L-alanine amidase
VNDLKSFDRGKKIAHWGVLRGLTSPGVLVECGFLTSDAESRKIATPQHRQRLAVALAAGIRDYAATAESSRAQASAASARKRGSSRAVH